MRAYCLKTLKKLSIYPLGNTPSAPSVFFARVVTDDATVERSALIRVQVMTSEFATGHTTDRVDEVPTVKVLKPILVRVVSVGTMVEIHRQRVFNTVLITSIL